MPIGTKRYHPRFLHTRAEKALPEACAILTEEYFDDVAALLVDEATFDQVSMIVDLPRK